MFTPATTRTDVAIVAQRDAALSYLATEPAAQSYVADLAGLGVRDNGHGMPASWAVADEDCPWDSDTCAEHAHQHEPSHVDYPHTDRTLWDCAACERVCDGTDATGCIGLHACAGTHRIAEPYGTCDVCGDPIDYCQGHGTIAGTLPTVEIIRTDYIPGQGWWDGTGADDEWERVGDGETTRETYDPEWDVRDYGTPVVWAAARIRDLSCDHDLEPSVYPLPSSVPAHVWLSATYENPYVTERRETSAYVYGLTDRDRAEVFRLAMLPGAEWVAILHAHRYGDR